MRKPRTKITRQKRLAATRPKRWHSLLSNNEPLYKVTLVSRSSLALIADVSEVKGAEAPRYDRLRDEPAFEKAWQKVAEAKAQGKLAPVPPMPPGGIRLRGSRAKSHD